MAAVAGAAGAAGHLLGGAGGGSGAASSTQFQSGASNTSGSQRGTTTVTGVQKFAEGGLITAPTLAVLGDSASGGAASEAVLPLDNPESMAKIAGTLATHLAANGGGGTQNHFHIKGMVSPDTLKKVMGQMNRMVRKSQGNLQSSNTFKITKRGG